MPFEYARRIPLTSQPADENRIQALRALFPEAFTEDRVDFERLKQLLGGSVATDKERYGLSWAGKNEAFHTLQALSPGTLKPMREDSVEFDALELLNGP